jgi:hypothetical protein
MERVQYGAYVIDANIFPLKEGGFSLNVVIEKHDGAGVHVQDFHAKPTYETRVAAEQAALELGQRLIDGHIKGLTI